MKIGVLTAMMLVWSSLAYGQIDDEVNPDRPSFSTSAHIVPPGHFQLEGGATRVRYGNISGYDAGEILLRSGLSKRIEVRAGLPSYLVVESPDFRVSGADDISLESKVQLGSGDRAAFGLLVGAVVPTGSRSAAEHTFQPGATFITDVTASKMVSITSNVGYSRATNDGKRFNYSFAVSTINVSLQSGLGVFTEVYVFHQRVGPVQKYVGTGVTWMFGKKTSFDINGGVGLPHNGAHGPDHYYGIGISRLF